MTDNEIIQALECCGDKSLDCTTCPYYDNGQYNCTRGKLFKDAVAAINRQKAEIERLTNHIQEGIDLAKQLSEMVALAQAEAIKEFVSMVKEHSYQNRYGDYIVDVDDIDNVMKEKVGE